MARRQRNRTDQAAPRIAAGVGIAAVAKTGGPSLAKRYEEAMSAAVTAAMEKGISDPDKQRALMLKARDQVKAAFAVEEADRVLSETQAAGKPPPVAGRKRAPAK